MVKEYTKYNWVIITVIIPKGGKLPDNYISSGTHTHVWGMYMNDKYQC